MIAGTIPHRQSPDRPVQQDRNAEGVEQLAWQRLKDCCPYVFYFRDVRLRFDAGVLTAKGQVGSFYLKQILQTFLQQVEEVERIDNLVDVVNSEGLSSVRSQ